MPEIIDSVPSLDKLQQPPQDGRVVLSHETRELPGTALYDKEVARQKHGINGEILGVITLPGEHGNLGKQIAIVDYGEFNPGSEPNLVYLQGKPVLAMGKAQTRYGLFGMNYTPQSHMLPYAPLDEGSVTLGRNSDQASYMLGLDPKEPHNDFISRSHLTIDKQDGVIEVSDHSRNNTLLEFSTETAEQAEAALTAQALGRSGLGATMDTHN